MAARTAPQQPAPLSRDGLFRTIGPLIGVGLWSVALRWYWPNALPQETGLDYWRQALGLQRSLAVGAVSITDSLWTSILVAVICVALTNVVVRALPFHRTTEPPTKFEPLTVSVKAALPAAAELGARLVATGTGLLVAEVMEKVSAPDVPPPGVGLNTVTVALPAVAVSVAGMAACSWVAEMNVVVRVLPFQRTYVLSERIDTSSIGASFENGVLRLTLPKSAEAKPRKIEVE